MMENMPGEATAPDRPLPRATAGSVKRGFAAVESSATAKQALADAVRENRRIAIPAAWCLAGLGVVLTGLAAAARNFPTNVAIVAWTSVALTCLFPLAMQFVSRKRLYTTIHAWVAFIVFIVFAMLAYFLHGPESALILRGWTPVLLPAVPVIYVLTGAFLMPAHARRLNIAFALALMALVLSHAAMHWGQAETAYGMVQMLITAFILGPIAGLLLVVFSRVQITAFNLIEKAHADARMDLLAGQREAMIDSVTGLFNREGLMQALGDALQSNTMTALARIRINDADDLRDARGEAAFESLLRAVALKLRQLGGMTVVCGRLDGGEFLLWTAEEQDEARWQRKAAAIAEQLAAELSAGKDRLSVSCGAALFPRCTNAAFAIEEVGFRRFMTLAGGSPV